MANKYGKSFISSKVNVVWSHLHKPDTKFGNPNHNITVQLTDELEKEITEAAKVAGFTGISKINGIGTRDEHGKVLKVKNSQFVKDNPGAGSYPCVDGSAKKTEAVPFGGDVVKLKLVPCYLDRDGSMSLYLDGCQIIEKNERDGGSGGFEAEEGAYDGSSATAFEDSSEALAEEVTEESDVDLPF